MLTRNLRGINYLTAGRLVEVLLIKWVILCTQEYETSSRTLLSFVLQFSHFSSFSLDSFTPCFYYLPLVI